MAILEVLKVPDDRLLLSSSSINLIDDSIKVLASDLADTMYANNGVGIAAPQVGVLKKLIVVVSTAGEINHKLLKPITMINPTIHTTVSIVPSANISEGCLSVPGKKVKKKRWHTIQVSYIDLDGNQHMKLFSGLTSVIIQHEIDHLNGVLIE